MPSIEIDGHSSLYYSTGGHAEKPVVLLHGSLSDHRSWDSVFSLLSRELRIIAYDRRGHSESKCEHKKDSIFDDADDLAVIIRKVAGCPSHVVGTSGGAAIALRLAGKAPELFLSLTLHEPPLIEALPDSSEWLACKRSLNDKFAQFMRIMETGKPGDAAAYFVNELSDGPEAWDRLPPLQQSRFTQNAWTLYYECLDQDFLKPDFSGLAKFDKPILFTQGGQSAKFFSKIIDVLIEKSSPEASRHTYKQAGHVPHETHPEEYVDTVLSFIKSCS